VKKTKKAERRRTPTRGISRRSRVAVLGGLASATARRRCPAWYNEDAIKVVDFSALNAAEKRSALQAANNARCPAAAGWAQCVATDSTIRRPTSSASGRWRARPSALVDLGK
jgi:hypothetical protein